jgi:hypothetical protein
MRFQPPMTKEQYRAEAARRMAGFCYTQLACNDSIEVWHCAKPDTGFYHFDITVLRSGMAVTGDIEGMLFNVGSAYGIAYLQHTDKSYIASKLEQQSCKMQFDRPTFLKVVAEQVAHVLCDSKFDDPEIIEAMRFNDATPDWLENSQKAQFETVLVWLKAKIQEPAFDKIKSELIDLNNAMVEADGIEHTHEAYMHLRDCEALKCYEFTDYNLECLDEELMQRLYMLEHAANAIQSIKFPEKLAA